MYIRGSDLIIRVLLIDSSVEFRHSSLISYHAVMTKARLAAVTTLFSAVLTLHAHGQTHHMPRPDGPSTQPAATAPVEESKLSVTEHEITLDGKPLKYRAIAGPLTMKDESGKPKANMFFVSYDTQAADPTSRPLTFLFNGGPGAAAIWLHMGGVGPKVVDLDPSGLPIGPPFKLIDNQATWIPASDLVFIDPVSTGYSRPAPGEDAGQFHGVQPDVESVAEFIRVYITKYHRWGSPIYLAGESYGTTRAASLAGYLSDRYGIAVNGITLVSSVLDFKTLQASPSNDLPYELYLPSYAAVAWFHKKLSPDYQADLQKTIDAARKFAVDEYAPALIKGASLTIAQRTHLIKQLAAFTSLSEDLIDRDNLRIGPGQFEKQLLGDGHHIIGRFDGRITGYDAEAIHNGPDYDPSSALYLPAYTSVFNQYVHEDLKFESDLPYEALTSKVQPWPVNDLYVIDDLQDAMLQNPHLRVQFISGYFDLATPFFSADYTINRMQLSAEAKANITHLYFPSGHMIYHNREAAKQFEEAIAKFVAVPSAATQP
jgi:carboxypeptidase C (cathepsin A)